MLPSTPVLPGAVLNGLGGDGSDQPDIGDGNWQISEYWTPMVAFTVGIKSNTNRLKTSSKLLGTPRILAERREKVNTMGFWLRGSDSDRQPSP